MTSLFIYLRKKNYSQTLANIQILSSENILKVAVRLERHEKMRLT